MKLKQFRYQPLPDCQRRNHREEYMEKPYTEEIKAMLAALKKEHREENQRNKEQRYACILFCHRERMSWSSFEKKEVEYKTTYFLQVADFSASMYYNYWKFSFTQDRTMAKMFTVEEAIALRHELPFETSVQWTPDNRRRCPQCGSLALSKVEDNNEITYTCPKNRKHKIAYKFSLFKTKCA